MKNTLQQAAVDLRRQGYMYAEIAFKLHVAKSTVHVWTQKIELTPQEQVLISSRLASARAKNVEQLAMTRRKKTKAADDGLELEAASIVRDAQLTDDARKIICAVMFWCEGQKDVATGMRFINADPKMIVSFLSLLRSGFDIDETKFRCLVHLHDYHDEQKQLLFWSELTGIPLTQFHRSYIKPHTGTNIHPEYQGCISLRYGDVRLGKLLKMIYSEFGKTS